MQSLKPSSTAQRFVPPVAAALLGAALIGLGPSGRAQGQTDAARPANQNPGTGDEKVRREGDLKAVEEALAASAESRRRLEGEIAGIAADRTKLSAALIETAGRVRATEDRIQAVEARLRELTAGEV